jgi:hypothetical protein
VCIRKIFALAANYADGERRPIRGLRLKRANGQLAPDTASTWARECIERLDLHRLRGTEVLAAAVRYRRTVRRANPATIARFVAE